ncbi:hypothetical protein ACLB2K_043046 [Fragaria x ananassa]
MVEGGRLVLSFMGRPSEPTADEGTFYQLDLLAQALMAMVSLRAFLSGLLNMQATLSEVLKGTELAKLISRKRQKRS